VRRRGSWKRQLNTALKASMTSGAFPSMRSQSLLACAGVLAVRYYHAFVDQIHRTVHYMHNTIACISSDVTVRTYFY
jgi:hypothetical protein